MSAMLAAEQAYKIFIGAGFTNMLLAQRLWAEGKADDAFAIEQTFLNATLTLERELKAKEQEGDGYLVSLLQMIVTTRRAIWDDFQKAREEERER